MKSKVSLTTALAFLLFTVIACSPLATVTPTASPPAVQTTITIPTQTILIQSPAVTTTPTTEEPTVESMTPWPTIAAQPAAPTQLPPGTPLQLNEIHMVSLSEGWGINAGILLKTKDGGRTWREVTPSTGQADTIFGAFLDNQIAWVVFSNSGQIDTSQLTIYYTTDGGQTWRYNQGSPIYSQVAGDYTWAQFAALDSLNAWLMVRGVYAGAGTHYSHELFRTSDGGATWLSLDGEISDDYTGMVFADTMFGLRTLQHLGAYENWPPSYDVTTDGGATWENHELPPPPDAPDLVSKFPYCETYQPVLLSIQSIHMLVGCFDYQNPPTNFTSYLYTSEDGGTTWTTVHLAAKVMASQETLFYFDANNALLMGRDMYKSADGGKTWSFVQTVNWDAQFSFVDPLHGWATGGAEGEKALVNTSDGGRTWVLIKPVTAP